MGNTNQISQQNNNNQEPQPQLQEAQLRCLTRIQLFMKRFLAYKKKRSLFAEEITSIKQSVENNGVLGFESVSKKKLREKIGNLLNELILRDDNSIIFDKHFDLLCSLQNKYLLWLTELPMKISVEQFLRNGNGSGKDKEESRGWVYYVGQLTSKLGVNGFGSVIIDDYVAKGVFVDGKIQSPGKIYYSDGLIYEGKCDC